MSIIIAILILSDLGFDFSLRAFADDLQNDSSSPQTKVEIPPASSSDSKKNEQTLEEQKESLFLKAFGKKIPETYYPHDMTLVLDDKFAVPMVLDINPYTQSIRFKTSAIMYFLEQHLQKKKLRRLLGDILTQTVLDTDLQLYGFEIKTDMKYQMVYITSPIELRKQINIFLSSQPQILATQPSRDQPLSGYINTLHALDLQRGKYEYSGTYNSNIHIQDWLFQAETIYSLRGEENTLTTSGRIVRDLIEERVRLTFGDSNSPNADSFLERLPLATGFQQPLFGVDISHAGRLARQNNKDGDFSYSFAIEDRSRIEIEINGNRVYNELVSAGAYVLQGFPFQTGRNDIIIRIISNEGKVQEKYLEFFHNPSLLPKGKKEYQFFTGLPYRETIDISRLDDASLTNLAYFRYGISDQMGLTGYMQTIRDNVLVGSIGEYGFGSNIISLEVAHSRNAQDQMGQAIRFQGYSSNASIQKRGLNLIPSYYTININYTSLHFDQSLSNLDTSIRNSLRSIIAPSMIWQFTNCCQLQFAAVFRDHRNKIDTQALEARAFYRSKDLQVDTTFEKSFGANNNVFNFFTNLTWRVGRKNRNRFNYRYASNTKEHNITANLWPDNQFMNYQVNSRYISADNQSHDALFRYQNMSHTLATRYNRSFNVGGNSDTFEVDYDGARALIDLNHARNSTWSTTTSLKLATSLAFVGKRWGISRPITESFAILYPNNEGMNKGNILFKNGSVLDRFSSAVYPFLGSYQSQELQIHSVDMPIGLDLGPQQFVLRSRLNSGQAVPVGKPGGIIMASAILLRPNSKPFDLEVGTFTYVDDPELVVQFFTNRKGKLFVQGLKSGTYSVQLLSEEYANFTIDIPKDAQSPYKLGTITLKQGK